jgi:fatty acid synthase
MFFQLYPGSKRPVWFVFTGMGSVWPGMGKSLLKLPIFATAIEKCHRAPEPHGVDLGGRRIIKKKKKINNIKT